MPLFADAEPNANTWVLIATIVVGGLTTIASAYFAMRSKEEPLKLRADVEHLTERVDECHAERDALRADVSRLTIQNAGQQVQLDTHKTTTADLAGKVAALLGKLRALGVADTDEHPPLSPPKG